MDKRTILAFGLIFLIYIGWMQLYSHMYGNRAPAAADSLGAATAPAEAGGGQAGPTTGAEREPAAAGAGPAAEESAPAPTPAPTPGGGVSASPAGAELLSFRPPSQQPPPVRVSGDLYDLEIEPRGGRIADWRGLRFLGPEAKEPVRLIPDAPAAPGEIRFARATLPLADAVFRVEGPARVELAGDRPTRVTLVAETAGGLIVRKVFTFEPGSYGIDIRLELDTAAGVTPDEVTAALGQPRDWRYVWRRGIASTESNAKYERGTFRAFARVGDEIVTRRRQDLGRDDKAFASLQGSIRFAGVQNRYFTIAGVVPPEKVVEGGASLGGDAQTGLQSWALDLPLQPGTAGASLGSSELRLYLGPSQYDLLKAQGQGLEGSLDLGWKLFRPVSEVVLAFMTWLHNWIPNYGLVIIILSVLTKVLFYPLTRSQIRSMKRMQEIQPKIKAIQEKYKENREKQSQKMMELYKKEKVNPAAGCLPLLVQMPVFIALYQVLSKTVALRQAPFVLWINDLGKPDALFHLPFSLPILGDSFNLLPILMAAATYFQTALSPTPAGGGQMAMMNKIMPFFMLFIFYGFPSGLVLYWLVNTLMTIYQTWRIHQTAPAPGGATAS